MHLVYASAITIRQDT